MQRSLWRWSVVEALLVARCVVMVVLGLTVVPAHAAKLERLKLEPVVRGLAGRVVRQQPKAGLAAGEGLPVTLWARRG